MTTSPEATDPDRTEEPSASDAVLDVATFDSGPEPRSEHRLPLDGTWHRLARNYLWVRLIGEAIAVAVAVVAAVLVSAFTGWSWVWLVAGLFVVASVVVAAFTPRMVRAYGYQLRSDDLVFRRGILWQRVVAVPYGRMQLVDITHGPLDRGFGIAQLKLVTAAATTGVVLPGLRQEAAEQLRDTLIAVAESRRTGL